jgi:hypothetical protein
VETLLTVLHGRFTDRLKHIDRFMEHIDRFAALGCTGFDAVVIREAPVRGRGLFATSALAAGHRFVVPAQLHLSPGVAESAPLAECAEGLSSTSQLAWFIMVETSRGQESSHARYLAALPRSYNTTTCWSGPELQQLEGSSLRGATEANLTALRADFNRILLGLDQLTTAAATTTAAAAAAAAATGLPRDFDRFLHCVSSVSSRALTVEFPDTGRLGPLLAPLADLFNHHAGATVQVPTPLLFYYFSYSNRPPPAHAPTVPTVQTVPARANPPSGSANGPANGSLCSTGWSLGLGRWCWSCRRRCPRVARYLPLASLLYYCSYYCSYSAGGGARGRRLQLQLQHPPQVLISYVNWQL